MLLKEIVIRWYIACTCLKNPGAFLYIIHCIYIPGVSKKVRCRKLQYFSNIALYQCNILTHCTCNFHLDVCKVSIQYVKGNLSYDHERNDVSKWTWAPLHKIVFLNFLCNGTLDDKIRLCINLSFDSRKSRLTYHSSQVCNFRQVWTSTTFI